MSEQNSSRVFKTLVLVVLAAGMSVVAGTGYMALGWKLAGAPDLDDLERLQAAWGARVAGDEASSERAQVPAASGDGPVVASAPIEATEAVYRKYMAREDVLVLVEYYADW